MEGKEKPRRTQAERSAATQTKILEAAQYLIAKRGLAHTSTQDIAKHARVSRGAMLHHFPSRASLIQATYAEMLRQESERLRVFARTLQPGQNRLKALAEYIWERYQSGIFHVSMDYIAEARVDADELSYVSAESQKFNDALNDVWNVELEAFGCDVETRQLMMNEFMCLVRGMAFQSQWRKDPEYFQNMLQSWLVRARSVLIPANTAR
ncbi:MAG: TetR/AcrR family transcriptional regulator [Sediminimonas qiaohouensis]|uniref:TetR/AcrR family transcriptional regulator n=1 Tax=Sediminimonas qiaohouensis TaxID=552061 RepID=A0A7C9HMQ4_9RHOB|nr:TetR/AcrR family transcriptional regulator [Sediminimonas qiaohouensis]MTJ04543.1 TetR/AcrR family transcriptional regulator [Sediminimonas qiaohouensis]